MFVWSRLVFGIRVPEATMGESRQIKVTYMEGDKPVSKSVKATEWAEEGNLTNFFANKSNQVFSVKTALIVSIEDPAKVR